MHRYKERVPDVGNIEKHLILGSKAESRRLRAKSSTLKPSISTL
jgi:hypothetical protein